MPRQIRLYVMLLIVLSTFGLTPAVHAQTYDCHKKHCGLISDGPYPNVILGTVTHVATPAEVKTIYHWARKHGYWASLQGGEERFVKTIKILSVQLPKRYDSKVVTLLMGTSFYDAIKIEKGDFVRYTPHANPKPSKPFKDPSEQAYWHLFGCIAVLCRAVDKACPSSYVPGVYGRLDGKERTLVSGKPVKNGIRINPMTYWPLKKGKK